MMAVKYEQSDQIPRLNTLYPLLGKLISGFAGFNLLLGAALYCYQARTTDFFIVNEILTYQFWGAVFFVTGIAQLAGLVLNSYSGMRLSLITGFIVKLFWLTALAVRQFVELDSNMFLLILFSFIAYIQFWTYIHFPDEKRDRRWTAGL